MSRTQTLALLYISEFPDTIPPFNISYEDINFLLEEELICRTTTYFIVTESGYEYLNDDWILVYSANCSDCNNYNYGTSYYNIYYSKIKNKYKLDIGAYSEQTSGYRQAISELIRLNKLLCA